MALINFFNKIFLYFLFFSFSFSVLAETSISEIDRLVELRTRFEKAGWTSNVSGLGYEGEHVFAKTINLYSPDYRVAIFFGDVKLNKWHEKTGEFHFEAIEIGRYSVFIGDLPIAYGNNKPTTEFEISGHGVLVKNIEFREIDIPAYFTVSRRVPLGGVGKTPANQTRAFYDGLLFYALHGGITFEQLNTHSMMLTYGTGLSQIRETFKELTATGLAKSAIDTFTAKSWKSSNSILPQSIRRGAVEIRGVLFQH